MRIAELVNNLEIGGAERILVDLALQLKARGHSIDVICLRGQGPLAAPLREAGIGITSLEKSGGFNPATLRKLADFMRARRIEVVHTHNPLVHHYGVLGGRLAGASVIVNSLHGPGNLDDSRKTRLVYEASCLLSSRVVSVCRALDAHLKKVTVAAGRKTTVIPNGISLERFTAIGPRAEGRGVIFGAVGRLVPVKDHLALLRAFALVSMRHPEARLEILGDGPLRELETEANQLGISSRFLLQRPTLDVTTFLNRLHAFVMCSKSEGLPLTLIEGMASGLPVVATAVGGIPELVRGAGCGWLTDPGHPEGLASCMEAAIQSADRVELGERGRRYAMKYHSLDAMTDGYEGLFEGLLARRRGLPEAHNPAEQPVSDESDRCPQPR